MPKTLPNPPISVGLVAYDGAQLSAIHGLIDMLTVAERIVAETKPECPVVSPQIITKENATRPLDALILPPNLTGERPAPADWAVGLIRNSAAHGTLICSVCAGAFWLADAGVLDGKRATTHWALDAELRTRNPKIKVDTGPIVLSDGNCVTAGGVMAWTDLGLYLLTLWYGGAVTRIAARQLVIDMRGRDQLSYRSFVPPSDHGNAAILRLQNRIARNCGAPISVAEMAAYCGLSERSFIRQFTAALDMTPNRYLQRVRMERARELLETSRQTISEIAFEVGYTDTAAFTKTFKTWMGMPPGRYRKSR